MIKMTRGSVEKRPNGSILNCYVYIGSMSIPKLKPPLLEFLKELEADGDILFQQRHPHQWLIN